MLRTASVTTGDWQTVEWSWNDPGTVFFHNPAGVEIKIRYGNGPWRGFDSQKQRLDGSSFKDLTWGRASLIFVRVQVKVPFNMKVTYDIYPGELGVTYPQNP